MWAVHGQCPQFSCLLLWSDLRVCAGLACFRGPKSRFGEREGGLRPETHPISQNRTRNTVSPQMARALNFAVCQCACFIFAGAQRQPNDQINIEINGLKASGDLICLCLWQAGRCAGTTLRVCLALATALLCAWSAPCLCDQIQPGVACSSSLRVARSVRQMAPDIPQLSLLKAQAARALSLCDSVAAVLTLCRDTV